MTSESPLFADAADQQAATTNDAMVQQAASQEPPDSTVSERPAPPPPAKRKKRSSPMSDPVLRWMVIGAVAIVVIWLAGITSAIVFGFTNAPAPRTYVERQIDMLSALVQQKPKNELAWADYAAALITAKQYSEAEDVIQRGLKATSTKALLLVQRARLARVRGDSDLALKYADEAAKAGRAERSAIIKAVKQRSNTRTIPDVPGLAAALIMKSEILAERKDWKGVVKACNELLKLQPTDAEALVARGDAYAKLKKKKQAAKDYRAALKYIPDMAAALDGLKAIGASSK